MVDVTSQCTIQMHSVSTEMGVAMEIDQYDLSLWTLSCLDKYCAFL